MRSVFIVLLCLLYFAFTATNFTAKTFAAPAVLSPEKQKQLSEYFSNAVPAAENFVKRVVKDGKTVPWDNMGVRSLIEFSYIIIYAGAVLPEDKRPDINQILPLLQLAEEMQDKNPESRTFGNFRWYWRTPEVTDQNAVEFVSALALPMWFECRNQLPQEIRTTLARMMRRSVDGCLKHRVRSDYTNIAIYNFVHLILLGQAFDRPDAVAEGEKRLQNFIRGVWDHGLFEYNSPTYYTVDLSALQLGYHYIHKGSTRQTLQNLLEYVWTDLALNWYTPAQRLAGPQSRTYDYLRGLGGISLHTQASGLAPLNPKETGIERLNVLCGLYKPSSEILARNTVYPRLIRQRWGSGHGQWMTSYILKDIALGTAGAPYRGARQNMPLTVDLSDYETLPNELPKQFLPRNYFIADGREDPYGKKTYPTSNAGHLKPLHTEAFWMGAQQTVDALGLSIHKPETLNDPVLTNVQSHFVFRQPDAVYINGKKIELAAQPVILGGQTAVMRYGNRAFGIKVPWTRDKDGQSPAAYLINDSNKYGVFRLTVDHWGPADMKERPPVTYDGLKAPTGAAFWIRIGSQLDSEQKFSDFCSSFAAAKVEEVKAEKGNVSIRVAGKDGSVAVSGTGLDTIGSKEKIKTDTVRLEFIPNGIETGTLELNGKELGRPILENIPAVAAFAKRTYGIKPIPITAKGTFWEAENECNIPDDLIEKNDEAFGNKCVRINAECCWDLDIPEDGTYYLWARVFAADPESDSFFVSYAKKHAQDRGYDVQELGDWHISSGKDWRWVQLKIGNAAKDVCPIVFEKGLNRLILKPRETDGQVDKLFLTKDPKAKPE
ncbi:hypothetical protein FACS18942_03380 [Planctomycetales bacterium]|nr:hypothetical protein FACS18942_03380 [Planctomycetales bacterium]